MFNKLHSTTIQLDKAKLGQKWSTRVKNGGSFCGFELSYKIASSMFSAIIVSKMCNVLAWMTCNDSNQIIFLISQSVHATLTIALNGYY